MVIAATLPGVTAPMSATGAAVPTAMAASATTAASPHAWTTTFPQAASVQGSMGGFIDVPLDESLATQGPAGDSPSNHSTQIATHGDELNDVPMWPADDHAGPVTAESSGTAVEQDGVNSAAAMDLFGMD